MKELLFYYQLEPPPPQPQPPENPQPPEKCPPPDEPEYDSYGLDTIAALACDIVLFKLLLNLVTLNVSILDHKYQSGGDSVIDSNFLLHLSDTPSAYAYGNIS